MVSFYISTRVVMHVVLGCMHGGRGNIFGSCGRSCGCKIGLEGVKIYLS